MLMSKITLNKQAFFWIILKLVWVTAFHLSRLPAFLQSFNFSLCNFLKRRRTQIFLGSLQEGLAQMNKEIESQLDNSFSKFYICNGKLLVLLPPQFRAKPLAFIARRRNRFWINCLRGKPTKQLIQSRRTTWLKIQTSTTS